MTAPQPASVLERVGARTLGGVAYVRELYRLLVRAALAGVGQRSGRVAVRRNTLLQILFTGVDAVGLVVLLALAVGAAVIVQVQIVAPGASFVGLAMAMMLRWIAPLVVAIVVISRSGSSITIFLGNMRATGELRQLELMGVDPVRHLVWPQIAGVTVATVSLLVLFELVSVLGGFGLSLAAVDLPLGVFLRSVFAAISPVDLGTGLAKGLASGIIVSTIAARQGLAVGSSITEVPAASRRTMMHSLGAVLAAGALLDLLVLPLS